MLSPRRHASIGFRTQESRDTIQFIHRGPYLGIGGLFNGTWTVGYHAEQNLYHVRISALFCDTLGLYRAIDDTSREALLRYSVWFEKVVEATREWEKTRTNVQ
jgi:hypothetical protein